MLIYSLTAFLSAFLLFSIQPLFAKMLLPLLGGAPAVWNTCMVFFQALLLTGYCYAHFSATRWGLKVQIAVQGALLFVPLILLPIHLPAGWSPPAAGNPIPALLTVMAQTIGFPFFIISTTAPLLQKWFSYTRYSESNSPYLIYAASNGGSFLALLGYPLFIERHWRLSSQCGLWSRGYWLMIGLLLACAAITWKNQRANQQVLALSVEKQELSIDRISWQRKLRWVFLAFVPSSLMLGVTTYVSTDVASIPLLWVIPLGLYLLTFVIVFSGKSIIPHALILRLAAPLIVLIGVAITSQALQPVGLVLGLHLMLFFILAMACHGELANDRPSPQQLTRFYLWMSLGGVCGGIFNSLLAPRLLVIALEYPTAIILACFLLPGSAEQSFSSPLKKRLAYLWPAVAGFFVVLSALLVSSLRIDVPVIYRRWLLLIFPPLFCYPIRTRRMRFGLCIGTWLLTIAMMLRGLSNALSIRRSFFGIYVVQEERSGERLFHRLLHGTTLHGKQDRDPARQQEPLTYFTRQGPLGQAIHAYRTLNGSLEIAALGLGTGSVACYAQPGETWTFFEIDPTVIEIAQDPKLFSYLTLCAPSAEIILGDARLSLARSANGRYGLIIADTFSSDAIPMHLITREAFALYFSKLGPHGLLVMNISNRYLDLAPVIGNIAQSLNLVALVRANTDIDPEDYARGMTASIWVVVARGLDDVATLPQDAGWYPAPVRAHVGTWTDDFTNIVSVFRFNR